MERAKDTLAFIFTLLVIGILAYLVDQAYEGKGVRPALQYLWYGDKHK